MREQISIFRSVYDTLKALPEGSRGEYVMGLLGYAFEDSEPGFDDPLMAMAWINTRPVVEQSMAYEDKRIKLRENGSKGGRPKKKNQSENQNENQSENQTKNQNENQREKQEKEKERERKTLERGFSIPSEDGAGAAMAAPPSEEQFEANADGAAACLGFIKEAR